MDPSIPEEIIEEIIEEEVSEVPEVAETTLEAPLEQDFEESERKRGRPRMTPEQKKEAKAARLKVVSADIAGPKTVQDSQKPKIIERVVREYVEVPEPATQQSPFESIGNVLRSRAISDYERKKQQWASFQLI